MYKRETRPDSGRRALPSAWLLIALRNLPSTARRHLTRRSGSERHTALLPGSLRSPTKVLRLHRTRRLTLAVSAARSPARTHPNRLVTRRLIRVAASGAD